MLKDLLRRIIAYRYELIAASVGAVIMMLELVGARIIAPFFGTSLYVWTAVIGVILGALSAGYAYGGRWADTSASDLKLALVIFISAVLLLLAQLTQETVLSSLAALPVDIRLQAFLASLVLFAPVNFFFGIVSPYVAKLKLTSLESAGKSIGGLYAAGTAGSIAGTFLAGYWLISFFGSRQLGFALVGALVFISLFTAARPLLRPRIGLLCLAVLFGIVGSGPPVRGLVYDGDSAYSRYQVLDVPTKSGTVRQLRMDAFGVQSAILVEDPGVLVANYNKQFFEIAKGLPKLGRVLVIGGGTFTLPQILAQSYPDAQIDVVEIDPKLKEVAKQYFAYRESPRLTVYNEDGRTFLNRTAQKYDLIVMDAFSSLSPPFQLTTKEAVSRIAASLTERGAVAVNLISAYKGGAAEFLRATTATYATRFSRIELYQSVPSTDLSIRQNIVLLASRSDPAVTVVTGSRLPSLKVDPAAALTDNYAPVERLTRYR